MGGVLFGTQKINPQGHLEVGGVDCALLAERFGTPLYVMDEEPIRLRCREYVLAFAREAPGSMVAFASKAFFCKAMASLVAEEGLHIDVASLGELRVALAGGARAPSLVFHGNYKKPEELREGVRAGVGILAIDSLDEMRELSEIARSEGKRQRALIRVAPGIDAHTLDAISTGRNDTKFGLTLEDGTASSAAEECLRLPGIELVGFHAHIGSQILSLDPFELLAEKMMELCRQIVGRTGWSPEWIVLGGGLGIRYCGDDKPPAVGDLAKALCGAFREAARARGLKPPRVGVEPGRSVVGEFGLTLYRVGPVKSVPLGAGNTRTYATVDGGLSDNPRPLMYGATYPALLADRAAEPPALTVRIAGRHCETDTLLDAELPLPRPGDLLAVLSTGAYNHTMASNYNFFFRPPVVFVRGGEARLVVRRETPEDLLARDVSAG